MKEKEMYPIIKNHLESMGFEVKAEINDIDIMAVKDNRSLLIEMKQSFSLSLIYQGIERQKLSDNVYLAILKPTDKVLNSRNFKEKKTITKRLGLGLIMVDVKLKQLTFLIDPALPKKLKDHKKRKALNKEFLLRETALNEGGITRTKIITAYRELALKILDFLKDEPQQLKDIVRHTDQVKATRVLIDNHYGWFKRVSRGTYTISAEGKQALTTYEDVIKELSTSSN